MGKGFEIKWNEKELRRLEEEVAAKMQPKVNRDAQEICERVINENQGATRSLMVEKLEYALEEYGATPNHDNIVEWVNENYDPEGESSSSQG